MAIDALMLQAKGPAGFDPSDPISQILLLLFVVVAIVLIINVWRSRKALIPKIVWTLLIIFVPLLGMILYFFLGREK